jgi:glucosylceramidase
MRRIRYLVLGAAAVLAAGLVLLPLRFASAAAETVNIWLTTTNDSGGRNVTRGLQQQSAISFASASAAANQTVTVNENTTYQQFIGAGASLTDTAAWLLNSSGALSATIRAGTGVGPRTPTTTTAMVSVR